VIGVRCWPAAAAAAAAAASTTPVTKSIRHPLDSQNITPGCCSGSGAGFTGIWCFFMIAIKCAVDPQFVEITLASFEAVFFEWTNLSGARSKRTISISYSTTPGLLLKLQKLLRSRISPTCCSNGEYRFKEVLDRFIESHALSRSAELALPREFWNRSAIHFFIRNLKNAPHIFFRLRGRFGERDVTIAAERQAWIRMIRRAGADGLWDSNVWPLLVLFSFLLTTCSCTGNRYGAFLERSPSPSTSFARCDQRNGKPQISSFEWSYWDDASGYLCLSNQ
jgi:hypothetical protein